MLNKHAFWVELLFQFGVGIFGIAYLFDTKGLPGQSLYFPYTLMIVMPILAVLILIGAVRSRKSEMSSGEVRFVEVMNSLKPHLDPLYVFGMSVVYFIFVVITGYFVASALFIFAFVAISYGSLPKAFIISIAFPVLLYFVFVVLFGVRV